MLLPHRPTSNYERQRQFCERNPGYYARLKRAQRAREKAAWEAHVAAMVEQANATKPEPLMLPAPVEQILIPGMNAIPTSLPVREAVPVISESQTR